MRRLLGLLFVAAVIVSLAPATTDAQTCSSLTVTKTGEFGRNLIFRLEGAPAGSLAVLLVSPRTGSVTLNLGSLGVLTLGLGQPIAVGPLTHTNDQGQAVWTFHTPRQLPSFDFFAQALALQVHYEIGIVPMSVCTSNVAAFAVGGGS